jgi:hypothetical protein
MMHVPLEQLTLVTLGRELGAGQACPQVPQLATLVKRSMQVLPPQFWQQTPAKHLWSAKEEVQVHRRRSTITNTGHSVLKPTYTGVDASPLTQCFMSVLVTTIIPTPSAHQACPQVLTCWADIAARTTVGGGVQLPTSGARAMAGLTRRPYIHTRQL